MSVSTEVIHPRYDGYVRTAATSPRESRLGVTGATDGMVVQRSGGTATLSLEVGAGPVTVRAVDGAGTVVTEASGAGLLGLRLPTGGPYRIEAAAPLADEVLAEDVLAGDLWILAGQSNMYGIGLLESTEEPHPLVHMLDMARRWRLAEEPLHSQAHSPDAVHQGELAGRDDELARARSWIPRNGAGLGLAFGREMVERTGIPIGLIPTAQGGTSITQWDAGAAAEGAASLYGSLRLSARAAGGRVRGVLWYQGESDATSDEAVAAYPERLQALIAALRRDFGPDLEFHQVQLGRVTLPLAPGQEGWWSAIRACQARDDLGAGGFVPAIDLELEDPIHIGTLGLRRLGRRLARLATGAAEPIRVASVECSGALGNWPAEYRELRVRITFSGLGGGLRPRRHVPGFSAHSAAGTELPLVFEAAVLEDDRQSVVVRLAGPDASTSDEVDLWYGFGGSPYCDLVDEADNAVPAFGPIRVNPWPPGR